MGYTVTVNTGYDNVALGQGVFNAGESTAISDAEYDNLVAAYGSVPNLEVILTIGGAVADPPVVPQSKEERITALEVTVADHEDRITVLEP
jgi:hypothetical protein